MCSEEFKKLEHQEYNYLNNIDIAKVLADNDCMTVSELITLIENEYEDEYLEKYPNDSCLFNCINTNSFKNYLMNRYGWFMSEIRDYTIYC